MLTITLDSTSVEVGLDIVSSHAARDSLGSRREVAFKVPHGTLLLSSRALVEVHGEDLVHLTMGNVDRLCTVHLRPDIGLDNREGNNVALLGVQEARVLDQLDNSLQGVGLGPLLGLGVQDRETSLVLLEVDIVVGDDNGKDLRGANSPAADLSGKLRVELHVQLKVLAGTGARESSDGVLEGEGVQRLDGALVLRFLGFRLELDIHVDMMAGAVVEVVVIRCIDKAELDAVGGAELVQGLLATIVGAGHQVDGNRLHGGSRLDVLKGSGFGVDIGLVEEGHTGEGNACHQAHGGGARASHGK